MKKKITLLFLTIFASATIYSQNYSISFAATGASSTVNNVKRNNPIPITVIDIESNLYHIVTIGTQVWMKENLKTRHYKNGTAIPNITDNAAWGALATGAYCNNNNTLANSTTYGILYNWYAVNTGNLCPTGWHVPTDAEWTTLTTYLGGESIAGGKLKEAGLAHWNSPNTAATNETGFAALPGGSRYGGGTYGDIGNAGMWWSSSMSSTTIAWSRKMHCHDGICEGSFGSFKTDGASVRCIKN